VTCTCGAGGSGSGSGSGSAFIVVLGAGEHKRGHGDAGSVIVVLGAGEHKRGHGDAGSVIVALGAGEHKRGHGDAGSVIVVLGAGEHKRGHGDAGSVIVVLGAGEHKRGHGNGGSITGGGGGRRGHGRDGKALPGAGTVGGAVGAVFTAHANSGVHTVLCRSAITVELAGHSRHGGGWRCSSCCGRCHADLLGAKERSRATIQALLANEAKHSALTTLGDNGETSPAEAHGVPFTARKLSRARLSDADNGGTDAGTARKAIGTALANQASLARHPCALLAGLALCGGKIGALGWASPVQ